MTKFRYFLIGVVVVCVLILFLSITGLWQMSGKRIDSPTSENKSAKSVKSVKGGVDNSDGLKKSKEKLDSFEKADQMIYGLYLPNYDESGQETVVVRSKHTALFENRIYKIKEPEIEFKSISEDKGGSGPNKMLVSADEGIMDIETNFGTLTGNVVIQFDDDTKIKTDRLSYLPNRKSVFSNGDVTIVGEEMVIKGKKLEVNLANSKGSIENSVEMEFKEISGGNIFGIDKNSKESINKSEGQGIDDLFDDIGADENESKSYVKGSGELVFNLSINTITFHDDVQAVVGNMNIFADQLRVILDSEKKKINKMIATDDVLVMSESNIARGEMLIWDVETGIATIEDKTSAEFLNDTMLIASRIIRLYKKYGWAEAPVEGRLITKSNMNMLENADNAAPHDEDLDNEDYYGFDEIGGQMGREYYDKKYQSIQSRFVNNGNQSQNTVDIAWQGRMLFKHDEHLVTFEKDVKVVKPGTQMSAQKLTVTFDEKNDVDSIIANDNVYISEHKKNYETEVYADMMTWEMNNKPMKLIGDPEARVKLGNKQLASSEIIIYDNGDKISAKSKGNLVINSDKKAKNGKEQKGYIYLEWQDNMVFNRKEGKASFYDRIEAFKDGLNIRCDVFDVFFDKDEKVKKIVALENVYVSSNLLSNLEGLGTMLTWDVDKNIAILSGDPVAEIRKEGSRTLAKRVFFDIDSRQVTWEGGTQWQMISDNLSNGDKNREKEKEGKKSMKIQK